MTVFVLKIIAYATMIIDHLTYAFIPEKINGEDNILYIAGRGVGRTAFIIFAFLIVEGYYHTHDRLKYLRNLAIMTIVSEIPYDLLRFGCNADLYMQSQNAVWTLMLGYLTLWVVDIMKEKYLIGSPGRYYLSATGIIALAYASGYFGRTDYGGLGVMCVLIFFFFWRNEFAIDVGLVVFGAASSYMGDGLEPVGAVICMILLHFYRGEKGKSCKKLFYLIYPVHMLIIGIIMNFDRIVSLLGL